MKHIKTLSLLLAVSMLAGCKEGGDTDDSSENIISSQSSFSTTTEITSDTSEPPEEIPPEPTIVYPEMKIKLSPEMEEIKKTLEEFGRFYDTYLGQEFKQEYLFEKNADRFTDETDEYSTYVKVTNGGITTYSAMTEKLVSIFTDNCLEETSAEIREWFRAGENDELYVRKIGAGGYLGESYIRINSVSYPDGETILLDMSMVGEKEDWGYDEDVVEDFKITLKRTDGGLLIDSFGGDKHHFLSMTLNTLVYNKMYLLLDNMTEYETIREAEHIANGWQRPLNETEQIIKLLEDYADFYLAMTPTLNTERFMDKTQKISVNRTSVSGEPYTLEYYKTVGLPANTLDELNEKLDGLVGENLKNEFLKMTDNKFFTVAENGDLYMSPEPYGRGLGLGMDVLYLDSIEYPDENTVLITVTSFGAKENWNTDEDIINKASAKLIRTDDGFRIAECDITLPDYFGFYNELVYDAIPQR